jgi:hypothetical protein
MLKRKIRESVEGPRRPRDSEFALCRIKNRKAILLNPAYNRN